MPYFPAISAGYAAGETAAYAAVRSSNLSTSIDAELLGFSTWFSGNMGPYQWCIVAAHPTLIFVSDSGGLDADSGASEPAWNTTPGSTTVDNEITWTCRNISYFTRVVDLKPTSDFIGVPQIMAESLGLDGIAPFCWQLVLILNDDSELDLGDISNWTSYDGVNFYQQFISGGANTTWAKRAELRLRREGLDGGAPYAGGYWEVGVNASAVRKAL